MPARFISDVIWAKYKSIINGVHDDFNQDTIVLMRRKAGLTQFNEDPYSSADFDTISLKCLIGYNVFRTWPMVDETDTGALDKESITVYLNNKYLNDNGHLTIDGNLYFDPGTDYFIFNGQRYRSSGETPVSQANDEPLFTMLILKRLTTSTSENKY